MSDTKNLPASQKVHPIQKYWKTALEFCATFTPDSTEKTVSSSSFRLVWGSFFAIIILLIWAGFAEIDQMARGIGQVVPSQRVQLIQNLEGGIVDEIPVHEGELVEKNQIVMRINNETADSQYREALIRSLDFEAGIARIEALIQETDPVYPASVLANQNVVSRHNKLLDVAREKASAELQVLALQSESSQREAEELKEVKKQSQRSLTLIEKQRALALPALKAKAYSELEFLDIEQRLQTVKSELATLEHSIPRLEATAREAKERMRLRKAELAAEYRKELNEIHIQLLSLRELLSAGDDKVKRTEMRSPVRGIVKAIYTNTVGGVVAPGATVMEIVPIDDSLIIEAKFSPADIAFVYPGQKAHVRLTAYDFSVYGGMDAKVESISADTLQTQQGETFYRVKVRTDTAHLKHSGQDHPIIAGMQAEVDILTGKKTILDYLLKPLLKAQQRALREK